MTPTSRGADCGSCCAFDLGENPGDHSACSSGAHQEPDRGVPVPQIKEDMMQNLVGEQIVDVLVPQIQDDG